ncbi:uncharacterized protein LOC108917991 isoform X2 [Anoplophora glabripennis]|uniref:uncharacterized protein LOC108917991 isoform X2 n=1 Tax=Anoplophora glabripennis TaxID=217634 RepID=UPI0008749FA0|nr:uncharacterized protein LOC108917991 isoform X2 [Anoplophora glabripennis]
MATFFPKIFKITRTIIPKKEILLKVLAKDRFGSAFKNDKKRIIFGLTSLLETHNQSQTKKTSTRGRLVALSAITFAGGVTLCYAKYDPDFRSVLTEYVPFIDPVIETIFLEKDKSDTSNIIQANDYNKGSKCYIPSLGTIKESTGHILSTTYNGIKKPISSLFSRSEPNEGKNFSKGLKNYIPSVGTVKDGTGHILSTSYNGIKKLGSLFCESKPNEGKDSSKGLKDYIPSFGTIKEGTGYILFTTYNGIKRPISSLFSGSEPNEVKDSSKGLKDYILSFSTIREGTVYILFTTYNGIKRPISSLFSGSEPNEGKDSSKSLNDYIPSFGTIKEGTGYILFTTYNGIKRPISSLFSGSEPNEGKDSSKGLKDYIPSFSTIQEGTGYILFTAYNIMKKPITILFSGSEANAGKESTCSLMTVLNGLSEQLKIIGNILKNSRENISKDDKWKLLCMWLQNIDNIYYAMETFNTPTSSIILSQYPKYSKDLSKLISSSISKEEDYSKVVTVLACATVISIQLLLIAYFNVPFTGQLENIAFSAFNATLLKDNPKFQELLEVSMKTIQNYVPNKIQSTDWLYYVNVMNMAYSFFTLAASYVK